MIALLEFFICFSIYKSKSKNWDVTYIKNITYIDIED
jgi:hypothetical protein